ncbi:hypothetical protein [Halorussus pelagicus]|uniref:hypothetical protein n=1 Tax=Halorussus pelagicus TaxID=2505977 RepID=UPI000FFCBB4A|nr:hypothetical protein [Halorussus pelagicus]
MDTSEKTVVDLEEKLTVEQIRGLGTEYISRDSIEKRERALDIADQLDTIDRVEFVLLYGSTTRGTAVSLDGGPVDYDSDIDLACFVDSHGRSPAAMLPTYEEILQVESTDRLVEITVYDLSRIETVIAADPSAAILFERRCDSGVVLAGASEARSFREDLRALIEQEGLKRLASRLNSMYQSYAAAHVGDTKYRLLLHLRETTDRGVEMTEMFPEGEYSEKWIE